MAQYYNTNLTNVADLIFYLDATNSRSYSGSGSVWNDLSPNRNHFTLFNTPTYVQNGTTGTYLTFNGTNQYARSTNAINFNAYSALTIQIGFRSTSTTTQILYETTGTLGTTTTGGISLIGNSNNTSTNIVNSYLSFWQGYGPRLFGFQPNTNTSFSCITEVFVKGVDNTGRQSFVNDSSTFYFTNAGVTTSTTTTISGLSFANTWTFIASRAGSTNFFNGDIAWIRAWGIKLPSENIQNNFNSLACRQDLNLNYRAMLLTSDPAGAAVVTVIVTDYTVINTTSPTAFSYLAMPSGPRTMQNYIASFGVVGTSSNDGSATWNNSYSGLTPLAYTASPITTNNYFTQRPGVNFIQGDGSADGLDWAVMRFSGGSGDFDGTAPSPGSAYFGSENTTSGASNGSTVTHGRVWGFSPSLGWTLLYVLDLPGTGAYNHTSGNWFTSGGTVTGPATTLGKRTEYDNLSITYIGFTVGTT